MGTWRLVLAWLVVANHTAGLKDISTNLEIGKVAVATFFFISGFLMPLTFDSHYRTYGLWAGSRKFYLNRILRIYPIYWLSLAATLLAVVVFGPTLMEHATTVRELHQARTYLSNVLLIGLNQTLLWGGDFRFNPPAWTLDVELQYYLAVPFILLLTARRRALGGALLGVFAIASIYLFFRPVGRLDIDRSLPAWSFFFLLGYAFYLSPSMQALAVRARLLCVGVALLGLIAWLTRHQNVAILAVTFACMLVSAYLLVLQQNRRFGAFDRVLGDLSYPTYILHWLCVQLIFRWLGPGVGGGGALRFCALLALNIVVSTVVAYASLRAIGYPVEMLRRRIRDGRNPAAPE